MSNWIRWVAPDPGSQWDKVRIYHSTDGSSFSTLVTVDICNTAYWHEGGASTDYYKLSFYDTVNAVESDLTAAFQVTSSPVLSMKEMRNYFGLGASDDPQDDVLLSLMLDAKVELELDQDGTLPSSQYKLAWKMLTSAYVAQWKGVKLLSSGNVNFAIDGISVQKPFGQWTDRAKYYREQYDAFMYKFVTESATTMPIENSGYNDFSTEIVNILHGQNNARNRQTLMSSGTSETAYVPEWAV